MKTVQLNKDVLTEYVKSVIKENLDWDKPNGDSSPFEPDPDDIPYQYVLEELVDAAMAALTPIIAKKLEAAGAFHGDTRMDAPGLTLNDVQLEIEEPLLDALRPVAKIVHAHEDKAQRNWRESDDDW